MAKAGGNRYLAVYVYGQIFKQNIIYNLDFWVFVKCNGSYVRIYWIDCLFVTYNIPKYSVISVRWSRCMAWSNAPKSRRKLAPMGVKANALSKHNHMDGLAQDCSYFSDNALELLLSCTEPLFKVVDVWILKISNIFYGCGLSLLQHLVVWYIFVLEIKTSFQRHFLE